MFFTLLSYTTLDPEDISVITDEKRALGMVVCRGTQVCLISPVEGLEEIANPFDEDEDEHDNEDKEQGIDKVKEN